MVDQHAAGSPATARGRVLDSTRAVAVTGAAGFIGFHLCRNLLADGLSVLGIDNLDPYYSPALKRDRLALLQADPRFTFLELDICSQSLAAALSAAEPQVVVNLAAQVGISHSARDPAAYARSNLLGFFNVLESLRQVGGPGLVFASSSSVYGELGGLAAVEDLSIKSPRSIYAATKAADELLAHAYSASFGQAAIGLRFFTVFGPWGRPDMSYYAFALALAEGRPIRLHHHGACSRDFTFIDDIIIGIRAAMVQASPFAIYNLGSANPRPVRSLIEHLEKRLGKKADIILDEAPAGDVSATHADLARARQDLGFAPKVSLEAGLDQFIEWFSLYHKLGRMNGTIERPMNRTHGA